MKSMQKVVNNGKEHDSILVLIGSAVALVGLLGIGNAASKLAMRSEHKAEARCNPIASDIVALLQGLLVAAVGFLVVKRGVF